MKGTEVARKRNKIAHNPKPKIVRILGRPIQRHHITFCIIVALLIYIALGVMVHEFIRVLGDSVLAVAVDRAIASVEEAQL
jgi:hypothetical protein